MKEANAELEKTLSLYESEFEEFVKQKKEEIVQYHLQHNKSYQEFAEKNHLKTGMNFR